MVRHETSSISCAVPHIVRSANTGYYSICRAPPPYARIAITLPEADLAAADRLAKAQDRSRSWIIAEAVRRFAESRRQPQGQNDLGDSRRAQLQRDLALTPEQRVREGEQTSRISEQAKATRTFSYDEFVAWRRATGTVA